jgi:hypothetical protein
VVEAAAHGADAILLIAALLDEKELRSLRELAAQYRMAALVEVHDASELETALDSGAAIVGVNNRNLHTFDVTLETSVQLAEKIPGSVVKVSESGIHSLDAARLVGAVSRVPGGRTPDEICRSCGRIGVAVVMVKVCGSLGVRMKLLWRRAPGPLDLFLSKVALCTPGREELVRVGRLEGRRLPG